MKNKCFNEKPRFTAVAEDQKEDSYQANSSRPVNIKISQNYSGMISSLLPGWQKLELPCGQENGEPGDMFYRLVDVRIAQKSILNPKADPKSDYGFRFTLNFEAMTGLRSVSSLGDFVVTQNGEDLMKIEAEALFEIQESSWNTIWKEEKTVKTLPEHLLNRFGEILVGICRGQFFELSSSTEYPNFVLPLLDVNSYVDGDFEFGI